MLSGFLSWWNVVRFVAYFFSLKILLKTLFSGWHRDTSAERTTRWERFVLSLIMAVIAFIVRLVVIVLGISVLISTIPLLPFLLVVPIRFSYERLVKIGSIGKSWAYGGAPLLHRHGRALYRGPDKKLYGREETLDFITRVLSREEQYSWLNKIPLQAYILYASL